MPVRDPAFREVVGRELNIHTIAHQDPDAIASHAAGDSRQDHMFTVVDPHFEKSVGLLVDNDTY